MSVAIEEDYDFALYGGPWIILDHYLTVKKWFTEFNPATDAITTVATWVRFSEMPIDLFEDNFLRSFGDTLGKTIKVDFMTLKRSSFQLFLCEPHLLL